MPGNGKNVSLSAGKGNEGPILSSALAFGVLIVSFKVLLSKARLVARLLDEEAAMVWSDGAMMLDCSNEELHRIMIQNSVDRGIDALSGKQINAASGESAGEGSTIVSPRATSPESAQREPEPMLTQVGGKSAHKRPVLSLGSLILKPLQLAARSNLTCDGDGKRERSTTNRDIARTTADHHHNKTTNTKKDENHKTRVYRGIREVAFYEAMHFASALPLDFRFFSEVFPGIGAADAKRNLIYLLSLYRHQVYNSPMMSSADVSKNNGFAVTKPYISFLRHCQQPCTQYQGLSNLGYYNSVVLLAAHFFGDPVIRQSVQTYAQSWCSLTKEILSLKKLSEFTPHYFGVIDLDSLKQGRNLAKKRPRARLQNPHLLLQDITAPFHHPNVMDIKMGTQTYEPTAPLSKQISQVKKYPQQADFGFRIVGMRTHRPSDDGDGYRYWDKSFGVSLKTRAEVMQALALFFNCDKAGNRRLPEYIRPVLSDIIKQLTRLIGWFEYENTSLAFYGGSILIAYDDRQNYLELQGVVTASAYPDPILKMIDFTHVCRQSRGDEGYLKGVKTLLSMLEEIQAGLSMQ